MRRTYRQMLREAVVDQHKLIALEAGLGKTESTASSELTKILSGEANTRIFRVIEAIYKFGNRGTILRWHEERLKPQDLGRMVQEVGEQLDLLEYRFTEIRDRAKDLAQVISLDNYERKKRSGG